MSVKNGRQDRTDAKAALICPSCNRTAPADGAWSRRRRDGRTDLRCPDCDAVVVSQPRFDADGRTPLVA